MQCGRHTIMRHESVYAITRINILLCTIFPMFWSLFYYYAFVQGLMDMAFPTCFAQIVAFCE